MTESIPDVDLSASNCNPMIAASDVQQSLQQIIAWNRKWRVNLSKEKTKIICFSKRSHQVIYVKIDDHTVEQVVQNICFGVILDENFISQNTFSMDIGYRKALKALNKKSLFLSVTNGHITRNCITLYEALVYVSAWNMLFLCGWQPKNKIL